MTSRLLAFLGAVNAALAVAAGAFGAHALARRLPADLLAIWETAARYHQVHALGLFAAAWVATRSAGAAPLASAGGWALLAGIALFSGSLYALALTGVRTLGAITPIGGLAFLIGWSLLAWASLRS